MRNFGDTEQSHAAAVLDSFVFFPSQLIDRLFVAAFDALAVEVTATAPTYADKKVEWQRFLDTVLVTHPTGEMPNVTDSGYAFDRRARQKLQIPQEHIVEPAEAVERLARGSTTPVVFVDDFVGSGDQFVKTWRRVYQTPAGTHAFASLASNGAGLFYYCPLICTAQGLRTIQAACRGLAVRPTHVLPPEYSANHPASLVWPAPLRPSATAFIEGASRRAGVPEHHIWGYTNLALLLAFEHGVPDATLPLMWWEENGWVPLVRLR